MKNLRRLIHPIAAIAFGVLVLGLLGGDAVAGRTKTLPMWLRGAELSVSIYWDPAAGVWTETFSWRRAFGADHYRITQTVIRGSSDYYNFTISPVPYLPLVGIDMNALFYICHASEAPPSSLLITITAYDRPDEATAYSESLSFQWPKDLPRYAR